MTLSRREKVLIIVGSIIIIVALYLVYFLMPFLRNKSDAIQKLNDAQTQVSTLNAKAAGVASLKNQIDQLNADLKEQWSSVPVGIDHARILLYLKQLTDGRSENVYISAPTPVQTSGPFLTQTFSLDFYTTYADLTDILSDLKKNELFNKVTLIRASYQVPGDETAAPNSTATAKPTAPPDENVINVHIEFAFYALPAGSESPQPAMTPTITTRANSLMPKN